MRKLGVAAALAGALAIVPSCDGDTVECTIDPTFTDYQHAQIELASDAWNAFTVRRITFTEGGEWLILPALVPGGWKGHASRRRSLIRISPLTPDNEIYAVALHEFGHRLGLGHVRRGVMDPQRQTTEFSEEDFAECRRVGACE